MKGLIRKDISLFALNSKIFIIFAAVALMIVFFGDTASSEFIVTFASSYMAVMCGMQVISTITYDEFDNSASYLMTLPISRNMYVYSKYLFSLIMTIAGGVTAFAITMIGCTVTGMNNDFLSVAGGCLSSIGVICVLIAVMIPIQLKYGGEKGRIVLFVVIAVVLLVAFGAKKIGETIGIKIDDVVKTFEKYIDNANIGVLVAVLAVAAIIIVAASIGASLKVVKNKEY